MKDLLRTSDLSADDLRWILDRATELAADQDGARGLLRGETAVLFFEKPSTRTRLSFETAIARLGGHAVFVGPRELQLSRGETIEDTARTASLYARAWIMRASRHESVEQFARAATIPVVNALTDRHHPCQSLADLMTMRTRFGELAGLTVAYVGAPNNVVDSLVEAAALAGMRLRIATPRSLPPDPSVLAAARSVAWTTGAEILTLSDPRDAVQGAHVVYTDVWTSMSDDPDQAPARRTLLEPYRVDRKLMALAEDDAVFMHCLPCHRGEEVEASIVDGPRSIVFEQAKNRLHTAVAVLDGLLRSQLGGHKESHEGQR